MLLTRGSSTVEDRFVGYIFLIYRFVRPLLGKIGLYGAFRKLFQENFMKPFH